jgi:hypothetical protein
MKKSKELQQQEVVETLKGARTVDFITPVLQTFTKYQMVKADAKHSKDAKAYLEQVNQQYRTQLEYLYLAAAEAYPEDEVDPGIAHSSLGPESILEKYEFQVIVRKKT